MVEYKCEKCEKIFNKKSNYITHINKKNPCNEDGTECKYCQRIYSRKDYLKKHMELCKKKNIINEINIQTNNGIVNNAKSVVNNFIVINPFLCEDMSKLTEKQKTNILKKCYMSIPELIKQIHFNPDIPENHNVYISNIKSKYGHINDGKKWILTKVDQLIDDLINKKKDDIEELLEEYEEKIPEKVVDKIRDVIASIEYDPLSDEEKKNNKDKINFKKQIMDEVKLLLYNNKEIAMETRKKNKKS
jgi:hypothetical protein